MEHLDDLGDDGKLLGRDLDPDIESLDQLCPHLLARVRADIRVWLQEGLCKGQVWVSAFFSTLFVGKREK